MKGGGGKGGERERGGWGQREMRGGESKEGRVSVREKVKVYVCWGEGQTVTGKKVYSRHTHTKWRSCMLTGVLIIKGMIKGIYLFIVSRY